jgi:hypothetical protein
LLFVLICEGVRRGSTLNIRRVRRKKIVFDAMRFTDNLYAFF